MVQTTKDTTLSKIWSEIQWEIIFPWNSYSDLIQWKEKKWLMKKQIEVNSTNNLVLDKIPGFKRRKSRDGQNLYNVYSLV